MGRFLSFLNLLDNEGNLSITNVAVYVALIKMILIPGGTLEDAGILFTTLASYGYKKHLINQSTESVVKNDNSLAVELERLKTELDKVKSTTSALSIQNGFKVNK